MRTILKVVLIGLFVLIIINKPLFVFALGEIDGIWVGEETISILDEQVGVMTGTIIFQESDSTLYLYDDLFGAVLLVKSGDQWVLPSPLETTYYGYRFVINEVSFIFHGNSYLTGTITVTVYAYGEEYVGHANLSCNKRSCQTLSNGATVSDLSGKEDSLQFFEIDLPPGAINLNVQTWGGSGDCDLYLIYSRPDFYNDWSDDDFNDEEITVTSPRSGKWYIVLEGWESYNGVNLRVTYDSYEPYGELVSSDLWIGAVINTVEKGPIEAVWQKGGEDTTSRGDRVIWGYFYASPFDVTWGSQNNPDLFVKIWFDVSGRVDVNFFHVSVPDIEVFSDYRYDGTIDEYGTTTMSRRYVRQYYENGQSHSDENYEDGNPPSGYSTTGNPSGYSTINALRIGSIINTVEKGPIDAVWRFGGQDTTSRGDQVVWGHFYANPSDVTWGSQDNPDLYVKIWFDVSGRVDVNYFHVSVPDIEVYSDLPDDGTYDQKGTTIMDNRYIRHEYWR
jgi:hypothetical protein